VAQGEGGGHAGIVAWGIQSSPETSTFSMTLDWARADGQ
jgi:hypothetical protein